MIQNLVNLVKGPFYQSSCGADILICKSGTPFENLGKFQDCSEKVKILVHILFAKFHTKHAFRNFKY